VRAPCRPGVAALAFAIHRAGAGLEFPVTVRRASSMVIVHDRSVNQAGTRSAALTHGRPASKGNRRSASDRNPNGEDAPLAYRLQGRWRHYHRHFEPLDAWAMLHLSTWPGGPPTPPHPWQGPGVRNLLTPVTEQVTKLRWLSL